MQLRPLKNIIFGGMAFLRLLQATSTERIVFLSVDSPSEAEIMDW